MRVCVCMCACALVHACVRACMCVCACVLCTCTGYLLRSEEGARSSEAGVTGGCGLLMWEKKSALCKSRGSQSWSHLFIFSD